MCQNKMIPGALENNRAVDVRTVYKKQKNPFAILIVCYAN